MTIPTQEIFSEWLALARAPLELKKPTPESGIDRKFLTDAYNERRRLLRIRDEQLNAIALGAWLSQTREIDKSWQYAIKKSKTTYFEHDCITTEQRVQRVIDYAQGTEGLEIFENHSFYIERDLLKAIDIWSRSTYVGSWIEGCIAALAEYFDTNSPRRMLENFRKAAPAHAAAKKAIADYLSAVEALRKIGLPAVLRVHGIGIFSRFLVSDDTLNINSSACPIQRNDPRNSERLFVFRMHALNNRHFRATRIESIDELMSIDGFRHQYDRRTIERLCAEFTGNKQLKETQNAPGQYLAALDRNIAGA